MVRTPDAAEVHEAIVELRRLTDVFAHRRRELAAACGLTEQQWRVLEEVSTEHFMPSMFARERDSSPAAVSKVLRQLGDKDLISVSVSPDDGRQRRYELTHTGAAVMRDLRARRKRAMDLVWSDLDRRDLRAFVEFGRTLAARLEAYDEDA